jgi:hypothetical protein
MACHDYDINGENVYSSANIADLPNRYDALMNVYYIPKNQVVRVMAHKYERTPNEDAPGWRVVLVDSINNINQDFGWRGGNFDGEAYSFQLTQTTTISAQLSRWMGELWWAHYENVGYGAASGYGYGSVTLVPYDPPTVTLDADFGTRYKMGSCTISATATDHLNASLPGMYSVDYDDWKAGLEVSLDTSGPHSIRFKAEDCLGQVTTIEEIIYLDNTVPSKVNNVKLSINQVTNLEVELSISWDPAIDIDSGIAGYRLKQKDGSFENLHLISDDINLPMVSTNECKYIYSTDKYGQSITLQIVAVDEAGNESLLPGEATIPIPNILAIQYIEQPRVAGNNWIIDFALNCLPSELLTTYCDLQFASANTIDSTFTQISDIQPGNEYSNNAWFRMSIPVQASNSHKEPKISLNYGLIACAGSNIPADCNLQPPALPNIPGSVVGISLLDTNNVVLLENILNNPSSLIINKNSIKFRFTGLDPDVNDKWVVNLQKDAWVGKKTGLLNPANPGDAVNYPLAATLVPGNNVFKFIWEEFTSLGVSIVDSIQSTVLPAIFYDGTAPSIDINNISNNLIENINLTNGTNTPIVSLQLSANDYSNSAGFKSIETWAILGGVLDNFQNYRPKSNVNIYNKIPDQNQSAWTIANIDLADYLVDISGNSAAWPSDGEITVVAKIEDNAGNVGYGYRRILVNCTKPAAPSSISTSWLTQDGEAPVNILKVSWLPVAVENRPNRYRIQISGCGVTNETTVLANLNPTSPYIESEIPLNASYSNGNIDINIFTIDLEGNVSDAASLTIHNLVQLQSISATGNADAANGRTVILAGQIGAAKAYHLERQLLNESYIPINPAIQGGGQTPFSAVDAYALLPHGNYVYRLSAENEEGIRTSIISNQATIPNVVPTAPVLISPSQDGWFGPNSVFDYEGASTDADGDQVDYTVMIKALGASDFMIFDPASTLENGKRYTWKVRAADKRGGFADSPEQSARFDNVAPSGRWTTVPANDAFVRGGFESGFVVNDTDGSGLRNVVWKISDDNGNTWNNYNGAVDKGSGNWLVAWPADLSSVFRLKVSVVDKVSNVQEFTAGPVNVDCSDPTISNIELEVPESQGIGLIKDGYVKIASFRANDDFSGIDFAAIDWRWVNVARPDVTIPIAVSFRGEPQGQFNVSGQSFAVGNANGLYTLRCALSDRAGRTTVYNGAKQYRIDVTPPVGATLTVTGLVENDGQRFYRGAGGLAAAMSAADAESGPLIYQYSIAAVDAQSFTYRGSFAEALASTAFVNGMRYVVHSRAINQVQGCAELSSDSFIFDSTPPAAPVISLSAAPLYAGDYLSVAAEASDPESGIAAYRLALGNAADPTSISRQLPNASAGELIIENQKGANWRIRLPESLAAGIYQARITVRSAADAERVSVLSFAVKPGQAPFAITVNGPFAASFIAQFESPAGADIDYEYRLITDGVSAAEWSSLGAGETGLVMNGDAVADGKRYAVIARGVRGDGSRTAERQSDEVVIDKAGIEIANPRTDAYSDGRTLAIGWDGISVGASELQSIEAIVEYEAAGSPAELVFRLKPATVAAICPVSLASLPSQATTIDVRLAAVNGAGSRVERDLGTVILDRTPPPLPNIQDQGAFHNGKSPQPFIASWALSRPDAESPVSYQWVFTKDPNNVASTDWTTGDASLRAVVANNGTITKHGETWYFVVRAMNAAGLTSLSVSDGITIDTTKPNIASVRVLGTEQGAAAADRAYLADWGDAQLSVEAYEDIASIQSYRITAGRMVGPVFTPIDGSNDYVIPGGQQSTVHVDSLKSRLGLPDGLVGMPVVFRCEVINGAGDKSTGYSLPVQMFDPNAAGAKPSIATVQASYQDGVLRAAWEITDGAIPVIACDIKVTISNTVVYNPANVTGRSAAATLNLNAEGYYTFAIQARNAAGILSDWSYCKFIVDRSKPVVSVATPPSFVKAGINFNADAVENVGSIQEWRYRAGTVAAPGLLTGGDWISTAAERLSISFDEGDLAVVANNGRIAAQVQARNAAGLWSDIVDSQIVTIDRTAPIVTGASAPALTESNQSISGFTATIADAESGVAKYEVAVLDQEGVILGGWKQYAADNAKSVGVSLTAIPGAGVRFIHGQNYRVGIRAYSRTDVLSDTAYSNWVRVDLEAPQFALTETEPISGIKAGRGQTDAQWVTSASGHAISYRIAEDVCPDVSVQIVVVNPDGYSQSALTGGGAVSGGVFSGTFNFTGTAYGRYTVNATIRDTVGNQRQFTASLRYNSPPIVAADPIATTAGKPLTLSATVNDVDGDALSYLWSFGDGAVSGDVSPGHTYDVLPAGDSACRYALSLTVTDEYGAATTATAEVSVGMTTAGILYADEYWTGDHIISGIVTVPAGKKLTIAPGARISADRKTGSGIIVYGTLEADGCVISGAERGVVVAPGGKAVLRGATLTDNGTGLHALGVCDVRIEDCAIIGNDVYGVKEDAGARPVLDRNRFSENLHDYYAWDKGPLTNDELTALNGNAVNQGE